MLYGYICTFHMPLFFLISGAVYYTCKREYGKYENECSFIKNKGKRLIIPYIGISIILFCILYYVGDYNGNIFIYYFKNVLLANQVKHLWFLVALFLIFISFNHFEKVINKHQILTLAICTILYYVSSYLPWTLQLHSFGHYIIFFFCGYVFQAKSRIIKNILENKLTFYVLFLMHILSYTIVLKTTFAPYLFHTTSILCSIIGCAMAISFNMIITKKWGLTSSKVLQVLVRNCFAIYLFHDPIIYLIKYWTNWDDTTVIPVIIIATLILSVCIPIVLAKIIRANKFAWIIGE